MKADLEIDVGKTETGKYFLEVNGERLLATEKLSEIVNRIEQELKQKYGIVEKKGFGRFFS